MKIWAGDAKQGLPWADGSVQAMVTSPPYWGLRAYGDDAAEVGRESREEYLTNLVTVLRHCGRALDPEGVLWLNIGDTASGSGGAGGDYNRGGSKDGKPKWKQGESGLPAMTWCNVPGSIIDMLLADGWLLRATIVWDKGVERAEALRHVRRPRPQHEFIFMLARTTKYRFYPEGLVETGTVWRFPPESSGRKGQAPFPDELVRRCLMCSTLPGMVVADPFAGSGTTPRVAEALGRIGYGMELYASHYMDEQIEPAAEIALAVAD